MTDLMAVFQHMTPVLAVGAASLGAAIVAAARDRVAESVVTRGHVLLDQALRYRRESEEGDDAPTGEENADALAQPSDDESELVEAAGRSADVVLAVGDGSVALDKLIVHGGTVTIGGAGTAGQAPS
ncbi:hypothetical protein [Streptomyces sp. NPDC052701]|uniref:hypothetical protein n=1 Tax=Streptomyces sp. NPDC052701 TaxID=3155533 RepID=UPI00343248CC